MYICIYVIHFVSGKSGEHWNFSTHIGSKKCIVCSCFVKKDCKELFGGLHVYINIPLKVQVTQNSKSHGFGCLGHTAPKKPARNAGETALLMTLRRFHQLRLPVDLSRRIMTGFHRSQAVPDFSR